MTESLATITNAMGPGARAGGPVRVLLFSINGAGERYSGPGTSAYRLYRTAAPDQLRVWLLHGHARQVALPEFAGASMPRAFGVGALDQTRFALAARAWVRAHARCFDVFHGLQAFGVTVSAATAAMEAGLPAVVKVAAHQTDLADKPGTIRTILGMQRRRRAVAKRLSGIIAISGAIRDELVGYGFERSRIVEIPNGVDTARFAPLVSADERRAARARLDWPDEPTVLFVGEIGQRKHPRLIVEALGELAARGRSVRLVLLGPTHEPSYGEAMHRAADDLGLHDRVVSLGHRTDPERFLPLADMFVLPSSSEGMPNALLEAMSCGLPCIGTRISGIEDLIDEGATGLFVEQSAASIAEAIDVYLNNPAMALEHGAAGRRKIERRYSVSAVLTAHMDLFARIMKGEPANPAAA